MTPVDALATPLRSLLDAIGSGSLPRADPTTAIDHATDTLDATDARLQHAIDAMIRDWESTSADRAQHTMRSHRRRAKQTADDGETIARTIGEAAQEIRHAAQQLRSVLDSFTSIADAQGPALYTPAGIAAMIPVAATHLQRALAIVERTRGVLDRHCQRLREIGRHVTPGLPTSPSAWTAPHPATRHRSTPHPPTAQETSHSARTVSASGGAGTTPTSAGGPPTPGAVPITLPDGSVAWAPNQRAATAVRAALKQRGVPYVWGGTTPGQGLDCSGLTQYAYRQAGVELPRLAQDQDTAGYRINRAELLPGDLAVWSGHVAMYVGNDQMVEAGNPVQVSPVRTTNPGQAFEGFYRPR